MLIKVTPNDYVYTRSKSGRNKIKLEQRAYDTDVLHKCLNCNTVLTYSVQYDYAKRINAFDHIVSCRHCNAEHTLTLEEDILIK